MASSKVHRLERNEETTAGMAHLHVSCAIIERQGRVLAARRPAGKSQGGKWEFPGGKIRDGEGAAACLVREIGEELGVRVAITGELAPVTHDYPGVTVTLYPFRCRIVAGREEAREHEELRWLAPEELPGLDWAAADLPVLAAYLAGGPEA